MAEKKHIERALGACAERGVPEITVPWPEIRDRALAGNDFGRLSRRFRLVPRTRSGLVFAVALVMLFGTVGFAATNVAYDMFQGALPGGKGPAFGEEIGQTQTKDGARVTVEWAYADTEFVVIGYSYEDLNNRRNMENRATIQPVAVTDERSFTRDNPGVPDRRTDLTDQRGGAFDHVDGTMTTAQDGDGPEEIRAPKAATAVFETPEGFDTSRNHHFDFEVFLEEMPVASSRKEAQEGFRVGKQPIIGPLAFDFEIPVRSVPVVEVGQKETVDGITLALDRVLNSPGRPQAIICVERPKGEHEDWQPTMKNEGYPSGWPPAPQPLKGNCWSATPGDTVEDQTSVTVKNIWGIFPPSKAGKSDNWREIEGPWTFEFEAPGD